MELKRELSQIVKIYLGPILKGNKDIVEQLNNLKERITKNEDNIMECQRQIKELSRNNACSANQVAACNASVLQVADEVRRQTSNQSKLYIRNSKSKREVIDTLKDVMGKELPIEHISSLSQTGKAPENDNSFIVQLKSRSLALEVLKRKAQYFKSNKSSISINLARTRIERDVHRQKLNNEAIKGGGSDDNCSSSNVDRSESPPFYGFTDGETNKSIKRDTGLAGPSKANKRKGKRLVRSIAKYTSY